MALDIHYVAAWDTGPEGTALLLGFKASSSHMTPKIVHHQHTIWERRPRYFAVQVGLEPTLPFYP